MPMIVGLVELLELADVEVMLGDGGSEASRGEDNPRAQKEGRERERTSGLLSGSHEDEMRRNCLLNWWSWLVCTGAGASDKLVARRGAVSGGER